MKRVAGTARARTPKSWLELARLARALGHPTRVQMVRLLAKSDCSCGEIVSRFPLAQSTVSQHLQALTRAGLVRARPAGRLVWYHLDVEALAFLKTLVTAFDPTRRGAAADPTARPRRQQSSH